MSKFIKLMVLVAVAALFVVSPKSSVAGNGNEKGAQRIEIGCNRVVVVLPNETGGPNGEGYVLLPESVVP